MLDAGTVVITAIEDDDLAGGGEVRHIPLKIHLCFFAVGRRR
jgi:hypothetical protein